MSKIKSTKSTNFRKAYASSGKLMLAGKNAEQNEELVKQIMKDMNAKEEIVLHTKAAGSPFVNIKGKANKKDIKEAAIFCAKFSRDWKKNKGNVEVHYFLGKDIYKEKGMKTGTFGVRKVKKIIVKKKELEREETETKNTEK
ncbi:MAG: NFACT RNA binding domain-containing protein [Candidatus Pacearchaeota archaeon]